MHGDVTITVRASAHDFDRIELLWKGQYIHSLFYDPPYSFTWPTSKYLDGKGVLSARVRPRGTNSVSLPLTLSNGNTTSVPKQPADWASRFNPRPPSGSLVIGAVGAAGAGGPDEPGVRSLIKNQNPNVFLYLGDIDEFASWPTLVSHYGVLSFDDPSKIGTLWGTLAGITAPTQGNHESGAYTANWRDYWHQRPLWTTFKIGGVRFYDLNSECHYYGGCTASSPEGRWLAGQLAANKDRCVVSYWHKNLVTNDAKRSVDSMADMWAMLARNGGDLVLSGHAHVMDEVAPLNASLQPGRPDSHMVSLGAGSAGARWELDPGSDSRVVWSRYKVPGAVFVTADPNNPAAGLTWTFRSSSGQALRTGHVSC